MIFPLIPPVSVKLPVVATGGTITTAGGWRVHVFGDSGAGAYTFQIVSGGPVDVEYLVVAGGGGGGYSNIAGAVAGGGGAGGMLEGVLFLGVGSYAVFVGAAGGGGVGDQQAGQNGGNSAFDNGGPRQVLAHGGGGGACTGY